MRLAKHPIPNSASIISGSHMSASVRFLTEEFRKVLEGKYKIDASEICSRVEEYVKCQQRLTKP